MNRERYIRLVRTYMILEYMFLIVIRILHEVQQSVVIAMILSLITSRSRCFNSTDFSKMALTTVSRQKNGFWRDGSDIFPKALVIHDANWLI